ncbi:MAG: EAL domain-containing protein [Colwellia sp.]|nr:EAL domain-containing protein [Colwellia sp.]
MSQPQIELSTCDFTRVEALCRMNHPRLGLVSPDRFIDKAEESELIFHITLALLLWLIQGKFSCFLYG